MLKFLSIRHLTAFAALVAIVLISACGPESNRTQRIENLAFSTDTVHFDTVFTSTGSATEVFKIYNRGNETVEISSVMLGSGKQSKYRVNLDGIPGSDFKDVEILPGDSLYCFVEVTIDPNDNLNPFVVKDSIIFQSPDAMMDIKLSAWGQNAIFHNKEIIVENSIWTNDKPHILVGEVFIAGGASLTVEKGTQIYGDAFSRLNIWTGSSIRVDGTTDEPVVFTGHRREVAYENEPGQWIGIRIAPRSVNNIIRNAVIKNGFIGLEIDSMLPTKERNVFLENVEIKNMSIICLIGYTANFQAVNCAFLNSCGYSVAMQYGGISDLAYCTIGNYQRGCTRTSGSVFLSNENFLDATQFEYVNDLDASFINCIIYGSQEEEIDFNTSGQGKFDLAVNHCLLRTQHESFKSIETNIINRNPNFVNTGNINYELDTLSPAIGKALPIDNIQSDLQGKIRDPLNPDMGAYERDE